MVAVYLDDDGNVRSRNTDRIVAHAGTTAREARLRAALWAAAADALTATMAAPARPSPAGRPEGMAAVVAPISAAPSYARTVPQAREVLAVIDVGRLRTEAAAQLAARKEGQ